MIRSALHALGLLGLTASFSFASLIVDGMTAYAVFSSDGEVYNNHYSTPGTTTINNGLDVGSRFALGGGSDPITYTGGGSFQTIPFAGADYNSFHALTSTLNGLSGTAVGSWSGLTPGTYTFTTAPTSLSLTVAGSYVFKYVGGTPLSFNNVNISLGPLLSSDDVIWYVENSVTVNNSVFGGVLVVDGFGASIEAVAEATAFKGRVLAESTVSLVSRFDGGDLSFNSQAALPPGAVPEPSTMLLLVPALALGTFARKRLNRQ